MRKLKINRTDFELAFETDSGGITAYLDTETGGVLYVEEDILRPLDEILADKETLEAARETIQAQEDIPEWQRALIMDAMHVKWDDKGRYLQIPKQDSREGYRDMQAFIGSLAEERLCELLEVAIQGSGAFRRFKDVIARYPEAEGQWFKFRDKREQQRMVDWLTSEGIEPVFE